MLSLEEAENFAVEVLKVPYSAERVKNDSISLLNELIRAFHATIPFQDLILISTPLKERRIPTIEQVKEDVTVRKRRPMLHLEHLHEIFSGGVRLWSAPCRQHGCESRRPHHDSSGHS